MNRHSIIVSALLLVAACGTHDILAADLSRKPEHDRQTQSISDSFSNGLALKAMICDWEQAQMLLCDPVRLHGILDVPELRREILQHPRFLREMMQIKEIRRELLLNEPMVVEMIENRSIFREIARNQNMRKEIENTGAYQRLRRDPEGVILEELLSEASGTEFDAAHSDHCH